MITLKLTDDQADELQWLLSSMNIEPVEVGSTLVEILDAPTVHPLWPVLKQLRSVIDLQPATTVRCLVCGKPIERSARGGKPKLYCCAAHKQKAVRDREKERKRRALSRRPR